SPMPVYTRFIAMIATSTLVMFGLLHLNTYALEHVFFSATRAWMALHMGDIMAIIMLLFMLGMYKNTVKNNALMIGAAPRNSGNGMVDPGYGHQRQSDHARTITSAARTRFQRESERWLMQQRPC